MQALQADVNALVPLRRPDCAGVYFVRAAETSRVKIGVARDIRRRTRSLQTSSPFRLELVAFIERKGADGTREHEKALHAACAELRVIGEWFTLSGDLLDLIAGLNRELSGPPVLPFSDEETYVLAEWLEILPANHVLASRWRDLPLRARCDRVDRALRMQTKDDARAMVHAARGRDG
jgi:hypothetical protein